MAPTVTSSPSRTPARARARSTPRRRRRLTASSSAPTSLRSEKATARSATRPTTRHIPGPTRCTSTPSGTGRWIDDGPGGLDRRRGHVPRCTRRPAGPSAGAPRPRWPPRAPGRTRRPRRSSGRSAASGRVRRRRPATGPACSRRRCGGARAARAGSRRARRAGCAAARPAWCTASGSRSIRTTRTRARSMWRRKRSPRPLPPAAPSTSPGMSAITNSVPSRSPPTRTTPEMRLERGERVVGDLGLGGRDGGDQGRLPGVGEADQGDVRHQLELHVEPALLALLPLLGEGRCPAPIGQEPCVAPPALAPLGDQEAVPVDRQIALDGAAAVPHHGPDRDRAPRCPCPGRRASSAPSRARRRWPGGRGGRGSPAATTG